MVCTKSVQTTSEGKNPEDVSVDTGFFVLKELQAKWCVSAYDYILEFKS